MERSFLNRQYGEPFEEMKCARYIDRRDGPLSGADILRAGRWLALANVCYTLMNSAKFLYID